LWRCAVSVACKTYIRYTGKIKKAETRCSGEIHTLYYGTLYVIYNIADTASYIIHFYCVIIIMYCLYSAACAAHGLYIIISHGRNACIYIYILYYIIYIVIHVPHGLWLATRGHCVDITAFFFFCKRTPKSDR